MTDLRNIPGLPRGLHNNNPGNLRIDDRNNWAGKVPRSQNTDGAFEQFTTLEYGARAYFELLYNLLTKYSNGTLRGMIYQYAPPDDDNNTEGYLDHISAGTGIGPDDVFPITPEMLVKLAMSMFQWEQGPNYAAQYLPDSVLVTGFNLMDTDILNVIGTFISNNPGKTIITVFFCPWVLI